MTDWPGWESVVESQFGGTSAQDTALWDAWQGREGAGGVYNPLNTTTPIQTPYGAGVRDPGSWNTAGVLDYPNPQAGAWATAQAVRGNAPGFARAFSVQNPADIPDVQIEQGFQWPVSGRVGSGQPGSAENQAYAQAVLDTFRSTVGQQSPPSAAGATPGGGPAAPAAGGAPPGGPTPTTPAAGGGSGLIACFSGGGGCPPADKPKDTMNTCVGCRDPNSNTGLDGVKCDCYPWETWAACYSSGRPVQAAVGAVGDVSRILGCIFSLNFLETFGGFLVLLIGVSRLAGFRLPSPVSLP